MPLLDLVRAAPRGSARLEVGSIQQREGCRVIPDLVGKGNRLRTVTVPAAVKVRIEEWIAAADIDKGRIFRPVNKGWQGHRL